MLKGEIWWADLPRARGSEPAKTRPVLIVQSDIMNHIAFFAAWHEKFGSIISISSIDNYFHTILYLNYKRSKEAYVSGY